MGKEDDRTYKFIKIVDNIRKDFEPLKKQFKILNLQKQIAELEEQRKALSIEIDLIHSDSHINIHDMSRLNELYDKAMEILDKLFNLEKELYYLQQNSEDIIPD